MSRGRGYNREQRERVIKDRKRKVREMQTSDGIHPDGEYAKRHPFDCGRTDCGCCHPHKVNGCESKNKDEHVKLEIQIDKEAHEELTHDMCDFGE